MTSVVLDNGDGSVYMFTRDHIKAEWLTRSWGLQIGDHVDVLEGLPHKNINVRNMDVHVIKLPKLFKLDSKNRKIVSDELKKWNAIYNNGIQYGKRRDIHLIDSSNEFRKLYPDSILNDMLEFVMNYDKVSVDLALRNVMQDAEGHIILIDPMVSLDLLGFLRGQSYAN